MHRIGLRYSPGYRCCLDRCDDGSRAAELYGELRFLKMQLRDARQPPEQAAARRELDTIENKVSHLRLPVAFSSHLYELRSHIELVRSKLH